MSVGFESPSLGDRVEAARQAAENDLLLAPAAQGLTAETGTEGFGFENIVGVGTPPPLASDDEGAVAVYVVRKVPLDRIGDGVQIPSSYEGVRTEIIETGEFVILTQRGRYRPAQIGVSVGHIDGETGTLGFVARHSTGLAIVSNNHVLARANAAQEGDPVIQPGRADHGGPEDEIGSLGGFVPLDFDGGRNLVDAAFARVDDGAAVQDLSEGGALLGKPANARPNTAVFKCGRTTGVTQGVVFDVAATVKLRYPQGTALLADQVLVRGVESTFSAAGDSGSLVIDSADRRPVGMVCGGSPAFTVINKIDSVLTSLGLSFADDLGSSRGSEGAA